MLMIILLILYWGYHIIKKGYKVFSHNQFVKEGYIVFIVGVCFFALSEHEEGYGRWKHMVWHFCFHFSIVLWCSVFKELKYHGTLREYIKMVLFT